MTMNFVNHFLTIKRRPVGSIILFLLVATQVLGQENPPRELAGRPKQQATFSILAIDRWYRSLKVARLPSMKKRIPLLQDYLNDVADYLAQQNVQFTTEQLGAQEKGFYLRILPAHHTPLNRLALILDRDKFPLIFSPFQNIHYHDMAHKFFHADLSDSAFYVGTWFLNKDRHLQLKVLAATTSAIHYYRQNLPSFLKDARLTTTGISDGHNAL